MGEYPQVSSAIHNDKADPTDIVQLDDRFRGQGTLCSVFAPGPSSQPRSRYPECFKILFLTRSLLVHLP